MRFYLQCSGDAYSHIFIDFTHTMKLIALNRFFRVVKPHLYRRFFTKCSVITMISSIWLLAVALKCGSFHFHPRETTCFLSFGDNLHIENTVYSVATMIFYVISPIGITLYSYSNVLKVVRHHQLTINPLCSGHDRLNVKQIKRHTDSVRRHGWFCSLLDASECH